MSDQLAISVAAAHGCTIVVALNGELDLRTVPQARKVLTDQVRARAHRIVVDLSGLHVMGMLGARALLDTQALLMAQGGSIALARPRQQVAQVLELTGTDQRIPVYQSISAAIRGQVPILTRAP